MTEHTTENSSPAQGVSPARMAWRRLRKNIAAMVGLVLVIIIGGMCTFAPFVTTGS